MAGESWELEGADKVGLLGDAGIFSADFHLIQFQVREVFDLRRVGGVIPQEIEGIHTGGETLLVRETFRAARVVFGEFPELALVHLFEDGSPDAVERFHRHGPVVFVGHEYVVRVVLETRVHREVREGVPFLHDRQDERHPDQELERDGRPYAL